ncbi:glycoside hydrolase family 95 protein [Planctomonas sp. JC2975]|uniref:glycosyl hydrolase family 95 catalytic domain-containing protein n=1 Tax=Planctomonas sp. JC2975 TaxID=2729626 RepID=UPI001472872C|nr:glycoside hydrolase N-terminal domain-containing protein [Planctomonas sp. JC2975]NNC14033.1 glycoside hydrolase family 95 protein [Planctomonas sp. JC2975]
MSSEGQSNPPTGEINRRSVLQGAIGMGAFVAMAGVPAFTSEPAFAEAGRGVGAATGPVPDADAIRMWYSKPGTPTKILEQGLPIGNGRLGALITGDPSADQLFVSDLSMWSGGRNDTLGSDGQFPYDQSNFGNAQMLANATLEIPGHALSAVDEYQRHLDLSNGLVRAVYVKGGVRYSRTMFASHPHDAIVIHLDQSGGGSYTGRFVLSGTHGEMTRASGREASFSGTLANGLKYAAVASAKSVGGKVSVDGDGVTFTDCTSIVILLTGGTNYTPNLATDFMNPHADPLEIARSRVATALNQPTALVLDKHLRDYRALFESQSISLGASSASQRALDTEARLQARAAVDSPADPELEAMYLQFGRYLTIAGSRTSLPINLQGPWLKDNDPPWMADYHSDINVEMNYWLTDRARLTECYDAFTNYCVAQFPSWTTITQAQFQDARNGFRNSSGKVAGWTIAITTGIYGSNGWWWHPAGSAWISNTLFEHYEFTLDRRHLERIYPLIKGACEFWEARLLSISVTDPTTGETHEELIDDADWSPEQGPTNAKGITYAQELVWQLFANLQTAARVLGRDRNYTATIKALQDKLHLPAVSKETGWLQEWMTDDNLGETTHRHLSPLIGLFPGDRINTDTTPKDIVTGATNLLRARGMTSYGWSMAWRGLCWARLKNSTRAYRSVLNQLIPADGTNNGTAINFFDMYSADGYVFQIDANLGIPSTMYEMLVYSRPGVIELLPASPAAWDTGSITSVGARGGFTVDLTWRGRQVSRAVIRSVGGRETTVRYGAWAQTIKLTPGQQVTLTPPPREYVDEPEPITAAVINRASGTVMSVPGADKTPGTALIMWTDGGSDNQRWTVTDAGSGQVCLTNVRSQLLADIYGGGTNVGDVVDQWTATGGDSQMWRFVDAGDGWSKVVNTRSGLLLSIENQSLSDGARLVQLADTGDATQLWKLV